MDWEIKHQEAEENSRRAYDDLIEKYGSGSDMAMTTAEDIGLPRMWRCPWNLANEQLNPNVLVCLEDKVLAFLYSIILGDIAGAYYVLNDAENKGSVFKQFAKEQPRKLEFLYANEKLILKEMEYRKDPTVFRRYS